MTAPDRAARPAILTVDDDAAVSRAVARDLRRRYGEDYRIVRAESGQQALEALNELKLRGEQVAILLADYRMPGMSGLKFLEAAMDIFPAARRVLLTAYADTDAAIDAINVVDLDHYLLKPWDPPEEKLYPVIDSLLSAWRDRPSGPKRETKVIGHRWAPRTYTVRDFLARNGVPYRYFSADDPEGARLLTAAGGGPDDLPVVINADGEALLDPTESQLAASVGMHTSADSAFYDLIVVGAGPAGLGAAVYGASEGLRTVLIEKSATGGQAGQSSRIENYLGFPDGVSGAQLTDRARRQATKFGAEVLSAADAVELQVNGSSRGIRLGDGTTLSAHAIVLACGVTYRQLDAPGLSDFTGAGVYYGSALTEASDCTDEDVYIVGGANSAGQAAAYFARHAKSVNLVVRAPGLESSMSYYLIKQLEGIENVHLRCRTQVVGVEGDDHLERITLRGPDGEETVDASHLFVFIGAAPRTDWLDGVAVRDEHGFVVAGPDLIVDGQRPAGWELERDPYHLETSVPGVFVAGDVRADSVKRVASAVGEGAMAVTLVHRYLEHL